MKKLFLFLITVILLLSVFIFLARNFIVKIAVEQGVTHGIGLPLKIEKLDINFKDTLLAINGLQLSNPPDFEEKDMLIIPEAMVNYDLTSILKGKIHLEEVRLDMDKFIIVKNKNGQLNINSVKKIGQPKEEKPVEPQEPGKPKKEPRKKKKTEIQIDSLSVHVGQVIYKDYSKGAEPVVKEYKINYKDSFTNVQDLPLFFAKLTYSVLSKTAIASIANINMKEYNEAIKTASRENIKKLEEKAKKKLSEGVTKEDINKLKNIFGTKLKKTE
ncbi:AsmA family protein [bacterium]|nr:AsmA family protein [bacterium]